MAAKKEPIAVAAFPVPDSCLFCPCSDIENIIVSYCILSDKWVEHDVIAKRPDWCPLEIKEVYV